MTRILQLAPKVVMTLNVDAAANPYQVSSVEHLFYLPKDTIFQLERICRENLISKRQGYSFTGESKWTIQK